MPLFTEHERSYAAAFSRLVYCNPFTPERIELEREALREQFVAAGAASGPPAVQEAATRRSRDDSERVWNLQADPQGDDELLRQLSRRAEQLLRAVRQRIAEGQTPTAAELELYEDLVYYWLYDQCRETMGELIAQAEAARVEPVRGERGKGEVAGRAQGPVRFFRTYSDDYDQFLNLPIPGFTPRYFKAHAFASFFQIRRAFHYIFHHIVGSSMAAARLRAAAWESAFTRDLQRYLRFLYGRMADFTTLIVGPSGTGKELVARAIGLSRYIPFDAKTLTFAEDFNGSFHPLNLSALSPTLIESELFGHRRGAFTGALEDRAGWLEVCRPLGTVFLDEVGDIDAAIQVKLLRVLQTRTFQRLGDTQSRRFHGKIVAATHRDLAQGMRAGRIREDFYYRICSDLIATPSLREVLRETPDELRKTVGFIVRRIAGPGGMLAGTAVGNVEAATEEWFDGREVRKLADEVTHWIERNLGPDYPWPGNFRELEQCVRNILIRGEYRPTAVAPQGPREELDRAIWSGSLKAEELLRRYCTIVQAQTKNYEETARRLGIDRRTVKAKVDEGWLERLRAAESSPRQ